MSQTLTLNSLDHSRGALLWVAKVNEAPAGEGGGVLLQTGEKGKGYEFVKAVAAVVSANAGFFATYHWHLNADGFPVADDRFSEDDPRILTRCVGRHVLIYSQEPTLSEVVFHDTSGRTLREVPRGEHCYALGYTFTWPLTVKRVSSDSVRVSNIRPRVLYLLAVD